MSEVLFTRNFMVLCKANAIIDSAPEQNACHLPSLLMHFHQYSQSNLSPQRVHRWGNRGEIYPFPENQLLYHPTKQSRRKAIVNTYQSIDYISPRSIFSSPTKCERLLVHSCFSWVGQAKPAAPPNCYCVPSHLLKVHPERALICLPTSDKHGLLHIWSLLTQ